ncbi:hypothetical protein cypCar_00008446 [Cyprinus carpio]|nr:hypothetical protein cypCar_00008446 [Cyprinus carpio]
MACFQAVAPQPIAAVPGVQAAQSLMQEASWVLRETVEVSSGPLRIYRKKLQGIIKKMSAFNLNSLSLSPDYKEETLQKLRQTLPETFETLTRVDQVCERLQKATSLLEDRLAELENWSTEAQEVCHHLKERQHRGHWGPHPRTKGLISRGLHLEGQVVTEGEDLQVLVTSVQKISSLPYLRTSALLDRLQRNVLHSQEVTEMLSSHEVKREGHPKDFYFIISLLSKSLELVWFWFTPQVCATAAERSVHLEALRRITESLHPAESVLLSTTHRRTDTKKVESVQCCTDSRSDLAPCQDGRGGAVRDCVLLRKTVQLDDLSIDHSQGVVQNNIVVIKQIPERIVIHPCSAQEEKVTTEETQSR